MDMEGIASVAQCAWLFPQNLLVPNPSQGTPPASRAASSGMADVAPKQFVKFVSMNQDQLNSFVRSVLKIAGSILVAHGATKAAGIVNTEDMAGVVVILVGLIQSQIHHGQAATTANATAGLRGIIEQFAQGPAPFSPAPETGTATPPPESPRHTAAVVTGSATPAAVVPGRDPALAGIGIAPTLNAIAGVDNGGGHQSAATGSGNPPSSILHPPVS